MTGEQSDTATAPRDEAAATAPPDVAEDPQPASNPVTAAGRELDAVADLPLDEQPAAYQRIHARLQDALAAIDDA